MSNKKLTLNNWRKDFKEARNKILECANDDVIYIKNLVGFWDDMEKCIETLLYLKTEQFKNMESMRHQSFACKDDCDDKICIKIKTQNQKIDEILKELKTL